MVGLVSGIVSGLAVGLAAGLASAFVGGDWEYAAAAGTAVNDKNQTAMPEIRTHVPRIVRLARQW
jgi:hypothetical protein